MRKAIVILALAALCTATAGTAAAQDVNAVNTPLLQAAQHSLDEFVKTKAPTPFEFALVDLEHVKVAAVPGAERDRVSGAWFGLFRALDAVKDPSFDPKDVPQLHLVPPPDRGVIYPAGVDPSALSDPAARATYQQALSENQTKAKRFAAAYPLYDLDTRAQAAFRLYRASAYTTSAADAADLRRALGTSGLSAVRQKALF
ncbi:MAG: hypothetical protein ABSB70_06955 [Candidatus Velthaea sp.]|jgi:hypothetical protein